MNPEDVLDDEETRASVDKSFMSKSLKSFPFHLEKGWELSKHFGLPEMGPVADSILLSGMGGSAIGGDIFADVMRYVGGPLVLVNRTYSAPKGIGKGALHIAVSYSGNTEETVSSFMRGLDAGMPSIGISSGGKLEVICRQRAIPFLRIPGGEQPRAALGYMLSSLLGIATRLGFHDFSSDIMDAVQAARTASASVSPEIPADRNISKKLAAWIGDSTPLIVATSDIFSAAERMKTQFNENSKRFAWLLTIPESNHNDWIPLQMDPSAGKYRAIMLSNVIDEPLLTRRMDVVEHLLSPRMDVRRIFPMGRNILTELIRYIVTGDYTSYYLAVLHSTDPTPVAPIEILKEELGSRIP